MSPRKNRCLSDVLAENAVWRQRNLQSHGAFAWYWPSGSAEFIPHRHRSAALTPLHGPTWPGRLRSREHPVFRTMKRRKRRAPFALRALSGSLGLIAFCCVFLFLYLSVLPAFPAFIALLQRLGLKVTRNVKVFEGNVGEGSLSCNYNDLAVI